MNVFFKYLEMVPKSIMINYFAPSLLGLKIGEKEKRKHSPSVKKTWAALYRGRVGDSKSLISPRTDSSEGVIK